MITLYCKGERSSKIMAMIKCPECGNEISDKAKACPICGCPIKTEKLKRNLPKKVIAIMSVVIIIVLVIAVRSVTHRSNTSSNLTEKEQIEQVEHLVERGRQLLGTTSDSDGNVELNDDDYELFYDAEVFGNAGQLSHGTTKEDTSSIFIDIMDWVSTETYSNDTFEEPAVVEMVDNLSKIYGDSYERENYESMGDCYVWKDVEGFKFILCWIEENHLNIRWYYKDTEDTSTSNEDALSDNYSTSSSTHTSSSSTTHYCEASGCTRIGTKTVAGLSGATEYYCNIHYKEIMDTIDDMEEDVGTGTASKHTCTVNGCSREGTRSIIGLSGATEWYCTTHYNEMCEIINSMVN